MAGKPGRSGGWNKRQPWEHLRAGRFRGDRHGDRAVAQAELDRQRERFGSTSGANALQPASGAPEPPAGLVAGLGPAGADFVRHTWQAYEDWSTPKTTLLRKAGELVDAEAGIDKGPSGKDARVWLALHRGLVQTLRALELKD